ncbi:efflux transporter, outer membrane factor (OMF) lipoprotein, NodT family [Cupriavidus sp. YR651]|uniref:efflux transporter outer membrane subunit n=1 Tax=Cupriavidus sp. YR651 TaxID=1855315 RepID=UPI0008838167|nr:efflux transporter outer membrane subunit [Cupriavidus sp. YR651]SDD37471.1 efflux transporter, outer membrane factor (OMF) lipoprotein, NodT family [Cupriavidus sp. YR651]
MPVTRNYRGTPVRKRRLAAAALAAIVLLAGCATAPPYQPPAIDLPQSYKEAGATPAHPGGPANLSAVWWGVYGDDDLDTLEARIDVSSQTLRKAVALWQDARAQVRVARSAYFPTVSAGVSVSNSHTSANVAGKSLAGKTTPDHTLGLTASWEPDLFGRIGNTVDAAQAHAEASADDVAAVRLGLQAELATDYFGVRSLDREAALLQRTIDTYTSVLELVTNRYRGGIATQGDVAQARAQLESTRAQLSDLQLNRAQLEHAIATLVGESASRFSLPPLQADTPAAHLPVVPAAVPSQLLERRPDIASAERRVAAANAQVGVARAAFFPDLILALGGGLESTNLAGWLTAPSRFWAIGPALVGTILDGGRRRANADSARAQFDASAADYRQTVLHAFQEVEDGYAAVQALQNEAASQQAASEASAEALRMGIDRYRKGAVAYLEVGVLEGAALASDRALENVRRRQLVASVSLVKALGGGWEPAGQATARDGTRAVAAAPAP